MPLVFRDIVKTILASDPGLEVVGELGEGDDLSKAAQETNADFVVTLTSRTRLSPSCVRLLADRLRPKVLALATEDSGAFLCELEPKVCDVGELSPESFITVIRENKPSLLPIHEFDLSRTDR
jgi:DNA-binding NarL/FixJ family response regulator